MQSATRGTSSIGILLPFAALAAFASSLAVAALPDTTYLSGFERCSVPANYCADVDADGYGDIGYCLTTCEQPYDFFGLAPTDCNNDSSLVNPGATEVCDGVDNNCDLNIDEGDPGGGMACSTGQFGVCAAGVTHCSAGGLACQQNVQPSAELCDGLDNNCDGAVDEAFPEKNTACKEDKLGVCAGTGFFACSLSGTETTCVITTPGQTPSVEKCNGLDDNCNGDVDEGNPGGGALCDTGLGGMCGPGITTCENATLTCKPTAAGC